MLEESQCHFIFSSNNLTSRLQNRHPPLQSREMSHFIPLETSKRAAAKRRHRDLSLFTMPISLPKRLPFFLPRPFFPVKISPQPRWPGSSRHYLPPAVIIQVVLRIPAEASVAAPASSHNRVVPTTNDSIALAIRVVCRRTMVA